MITTVREFLSSTPGKIASVVFAVITLGAAILFGLGQFSNPQAATANTRVFVDEKTGKPFNHTPRPGDEIPVPAPSGGRTGYEGTPCYWTKDGKAKGDATWVIIKDRETPVFCPDCDRLVRPYNPAPLPDGSNVPPTRAEFEARRNP